VEKDVRQDEALDVVDPLEGDLPAQGLEGDRSVLGAIDLRRLSCRPSSSANVASSSENLGGSAPDKRQTQSRDMSVAMRICDANGSMSGKNRKPMKAAGSILRASQCAAALPSRCRKVVSARISGGMVI
jgi:hypothetical protein